MASIGRGFRFPGRSRADTAAQSGEALPAAPVRVAAARPQPAAAQSVPSGVRIASEWSWRLGVVALVLYVLTRVFAQFAGILVPLLIAVMLASLMYPITDWLARRIPRGPAALATLLGLLLLVVGLFGLVGQQSAAGFPELRAQAIDGFGQVRTWLADGPLDINTSDLSKYLNDANQAVSENRSSLTTGALGAAATLSHLVEGLFIALFALFFFLSSGHRIWAWLLRILPLAAQRPVDDAARSGFVTLSHYVRATVIVAAVDGIGIGVGAALLSVPLALPLGVLVFLGAFIPLIGAVLTGGVAILVALVAQGPVTALLMLGVVVLVQQIETHVLQPFLLGRSVDVHPLAVILAIATGVALAGILGALFAVPIVAVANTMITALASRGGPDPGELIDSEDAPLAPAKPAATDTS
jgi:predicted PurR-regulated permease PerM